jgi:hypothetical protein
LWRLGVVLLIAAVVMVLFLFNPSQYGFYPRCALYTTTGIYCPGCGSLRALHHLVHGHFAMALRCNPLLILSLPFAAFYFWHYLGRWITGEPLPPLVMRPGWIKLLAVVVILFTILRNIPHAPFIYLAPP